MLKKDAREPYKEIGVAQCFQGLRRFCFQTRDSYTHNYDKKKLSVYQAFSDKNFIKIFV